MNVLHSQISPIVVKEVCLQHLVRQGGAGWPRRVTGVNTSGSWPTRHFEQAGAVTSAPQTLGVPCAPTPHNKTYSLHSAPYLCNPTGAGFYFLRILSLPHDSARALDVPRQLAYCIALDSFARHLGSSFQPSHLVIHHAFSIAQSLAFVTI
jgi:hypothetical protein